MASPRTCAEVSLLVRSRFIASEWSSEGGCVSVDERAAGADTAIGIWSVEERSCMLAHDQVSHV